MAPLPTVCSASMPSSTRRTRSRCSPRLADQTPARAGHSAPTPLTALAASKRLLGPALDRGQRWAPVTRSEQDCSMISDDRAAIRAGQQHHWAEVLAANPDMYGLEPSSAAIHAAERFAARGVTTV